MADLANPNSQSSPDSGDHLSHLLVPELEEPFFRSVIRNFRELLHPQKLPPLQVTSKPVDVAMTGTLPFYKTLYQNLRDIISPPKLPPLEVTSKPVPVKDIWGLYGRQKKSFMMSTGFQVALVTAAFVLGSTKPVQMAVHQAALIFAPELDVKPLAPAKALRRSYLKKIKE